VFILKGILLAIVLFVIAALAFFYAVVPKNVGFGQVAISVEILNKVGMLTTGFGLGMLVIGSTLLWISRAATSYLLNQLQNMKR